MTATTTAETGKDRIPGPLAKQAIFVEFLSRYLDGYDEISAYNSKVLTEKDPEWNSYKIMDKAKELARPASGEANEDIKKVLEQWESLVSEVNRAKQEVLKVTSKELGIEYNATGERDLELEASLKEKRKVGINIGQQLVELSKLTVDPKVKDALTSFLKEYEMPAVGRNQTHSFSADGSTGAPKYRVKVTVVRQEDGEELFTEDGFTKTCAALTKFYDRGKALKPEAFRKVWEGAGNSMGNTVQPVVDFTDNGLVFTITQK